MIPKTSPFAPSLGSAHLLKPCYTADDRCIAESALDKNVCSLLLGVGKEGSKMSIKSDGYKYNQR